MTAQEAKALTQSKKKTFEDILYSIRVMAEAGHDSAAFELDRINDVEAYTEALEEMGYTVRVLTSTFSVSWK